MNVQIIIPIFNPDDKFRRLLISLQKQSLKGISILIIDSGSDEIYRKWLWDDNRIIIKKIEQKSFNHGGTRQMGINMFPDKDIYIFLTQDAILADNKSIESIILAFNSENVGCAYGRQLPHEEASWFAGMARKINYPDKSYVRSYADRNKYGMKTAFISNSFAAYRREAMENIGGFPSNTVLSEDMWVAAKMLMHGWKIAYVSKAQVYHSHNYTVIQEFRRYFDIGVFHSRERWIKKKFGGAGGAGIDFIKKEITEIQKYCLKTQIRLFSEMMIRDSLKLVGYKIGELEFFLPILLKKKLSMCRYFWN